MGFLSNIWPLGSSDRLTKSQHILDLMQRVRISDSHTVFSGTVTLGKSPYTWDEVVGGTGSTSTWNSTEISVDMKVTKDGDYVIRKTRECFNYQAGKTQHATCMGIFPCYPGVEVRVGVWTPSTTAPHKPTSGYYFATLN